MLRGGASIVLLAVVLPLASAGDALDQPGHRRRGPAIGGELHRNRLKRRGHRHPSFVEVAAGIAEHLRGDGGSAELMLARRPQRFDLSGGAGGDDDSHAGADSAVQNRSGHFWDGGNSQLDNPSDGGGQHVGGGSGPHSGDGVAYSRLGQAEPRAKHDNIAVEKDDSMPSSRKHSMVERHGLAPAQEACEEDFNCDTVCLYLDGATEAVCANEEQIKKARMLSRGPMKYSFSCLPPFKDNTQVCGHQHPMTMCELTISPVAYRARVEDVAANRGIDWAHAQTRKRVKTLQRYKIKGIITLENGHTSECMIERSLPPNSPDSKADLVERRSCGDDAVSGNAQGNPLIVRTWVRAIMEQGVDPGDREIQLSADIVAATKKLVNNATGDKVRADVDTDRWKLVPIPDGSAVRLPYMMLWRKYADDMFNAFCGSKTTDGKYPLDAQGEACRVSTHCVGGNGRTGIMLMANFLVQLRLQNVEKQSIDPKTTNDLSNVSGYVQLTEVSRDFQYEKAAYYAGQDITGLKEDDVCVVTFCNEDKLEYLKEKAFLPKVDRDVEKLRRRCKIGCALASTQGMERFEESDGGGPNEYIRGSRVPIAVMHALTTLFTIRGLKSAELFQVVAQNRPPGNLMRLVQWWECMNDVNWSIKYRVTPETLDGQDDGVHHDLVFTLDCKDRSIFAPNEYGIYTNAEEDNHRYKWVNGTDVEKAILPIGPEETNRIWLPTRHELPKGVKYRGEKRWGGALAASCGKGLTAIQDGSRQPTDCLAETDVGAGGSDCDSTECQGKDPAALRKARNEDRGYRYFIKSQTCARMLIDKVMERAEPLWSEKSTAQKALGGAGAGPGKLSAEVNAHNELTVAASASIRFTATAGLNASTLHEAKESEKRVEAQSPQATASNQAPAVEVVNRVWGVAGLRCPDLPGGPQP